MLNIQLKKPLKLAVVSIIAISITACGNQNDAGENNEPAMLDNSAEAIHERVMTLDSHIDVNADMTYDPKYDPGVLTINKLIWLKWNPVD